MVNVGGGCFIILSRTEYSNMYTQFKSVDNCNTWINQGTFNILNSGDTSGTPAPPFLSLINYEGIGIIACFFTDRTTSTLYVVYGLVNNILEGTNGWNSNTVKNIICDGTYRSGYQSFSLPVNQYKDIGVQFIEDGDYKAYPIVVFPNISDMKNVLITLSL